jgi:hypothetical protein
MKGAGTLPVTGAAFLAILAACGGSRPESPKLSTTELLRVPKPWGTWSFSVSRDGTKGACTGTLAMGAQYRYFINGAESEDFDHLVPIVFNADGSRWCSIGRQAGSKVVLDSGKKSPAYFDAFSAGFSPDGSKLAFVAVRKDGAASKYFVVIDGVPGEEFDRIDATVDWSPDSKTLVYRAFAGRKSFFVVNGKRIGDEFEENRSSS